MKHLYRAAALWTAVLTLLSVPAFAEEAGPGNGEETPATVGASEWLAADGLLYSADFRFTVDPFEKDGRGQVYSSYIRVVNTNPYPVEAEIVSPLVVTNDPAVRVRDRPVRTDFWNPTDNKDICLILRRADDDMAPELVLNERLPRAPYRFTLGASTGAPLPEAFTLGGSGRGVPAAGPNEAVFEIVGTVSVYPLEEWRAGDVTVTLSFAAQPAEGYEALALNEEEPEIEEPLEEIEEPEEDPGPTVGTSGETA